MKTSVALCTYNGQLYLSEQLESILLQTINVDEIVVCDDSSNHDTWKILQQYQKKYPEIFRIFRNETALGIIGNFEKAINLCTGDVVFLSDQDDIWFPEKTQKIVEFFQKNPHDKAVFHNLQLYKDNHPQNKTLWESLSFDKNFRKKEFISKHILLFDNIITGAALSFRNDNNFTFKNTGTELHDYLLALHFIQQNALGIMDEILGYYRIHDLQNVGTSLEQNAYQKKISRMQDFYYKETNLAEKLRIIERGLRNNENLKQGFPELYSKNAVEFSKEIALTKQKFLHSQNFWQRKRILVSWFLQKKYKTTWSEIFIN